MSTEYAHHLDLTRSQLQGATIALVPGDPGRVPTISQHLERAQELAFSREFRTHLGWLEDRPLLVTSSGCGGPSLSVAVEELARLGVRTFIRVGSSGALQDQIELGDLVITSGAVRRDGASRDFAPLEYPAVADFEVTRALVEACQGHRHHVGITASSDTFYPGQERYDTHSGYVIRRLQGSLEEWKALNVLNMEMEAATLLTMASALGLRAGVVCGIVAQRGQSDQIAPPEVFARATEAAIEVALRAAAAL